MNENNIIGVILAGGKSKRIGRDKSTIKLGRLLNLFTKIRFETAEIDP